MSRRWSESDGWAVAILLVAAFLRLVLLGQIPSALEYDEAANVILAGEVATGKSLPVFIRPYTGKEVLYFYLAAGLMRLGGITPFVLRLCSAFLGILGVALCYWLARQVFAVGGVDERERRWLALLSAALVAVSYWQVNLSRLGYRAIVLPPLLSLCFGSLLRGLRVSPGRGAALARRDAVIARRNAVIAPSGSEMTSPLRRWVPWAWIAAAGAWAGLSAYTYSSVRTLPILLLLVWIWVVVADRRRWRLRVGQLLAFGAVALLVFAPLGLFFLRHPETLTVRLDQVSVFSPAVHRGDPWGTLWRTVRLALGMFTRAGDMNPLYNFPGKPVFDRILGPFFALGLLLCAWGLLAPRSMARLVPWMPAQTQPPNHLTTPHTERGESPIHPPFHSFRFPFFFLLSWLLVMMIPNVLSASGVPHNLRAMALVPALFIVSAVGIVTVVEWLVRWIEWGERGLPRRHGGHRGESEQAPVSRGGLSGSLFSISLPISLLLLLSYGLTRTYRDYVNVWARSAAPYYKGNEALLHAAKLLNAHPEADPYVATYFQQHATLAVAADRYADIRWMSGRTVVLPPPGARPALLIYDHTTPIDPVLRDRLLPPDALFHRELGPDGEVGFEAYYVSGAQAREQEVAPQVPVQANLGHVLTFLGYDLNAPPVSGDVLDVTLYFEVQRAAEQDDWTFFAHLVDDLGFRWGGVTFFHYPSAQWRPGEVIVFRQQLELVPGAPPGAYTLDVGVFSPSLDARLPVLVEGANGVWQMAGTALPVGPIEIARAAAPPSALPPIQQPLQATFTGPPQAGEPPGPGGPDSEDALLYLGSDRDRSDLRPGETLALTLYWQAGPAVERARAVSVSLVAEGQDVPLWKGPPVHGLYPFSRWQPGEFVRDRYALRLPLDLPAGDYDLRLALLDENGETTKVVTTSEPVGSNDFSRSLSLGTIHVHASDRLWEPPAIQHPVGARLGQQVELLGYDLVGDGVAPGVRVAPGDILHLTLHWRALEPMDVAYTVFTHLLDEGGQVRGQKDNPPVQGSYPTTVWVPGEVVVDAFEIPIAADAAPGSYVMEVGMYDPVTMQRLPVLDPTGALGDRVLLAQVEVAD